MDYKCDKNEYKHENSEKVYCQIYIQKISDNKCPVLPRGANNKQTYVFIHSFSDFLNNNKKLYKINDIAKELNINYFEFKKHLKDLGRINNGKNLLLFEQNYNPQKVFEYLESLILLKKIQ